MSARDQLIATAQALAAHPPLREANFPYGGGIIIIKEASYFTTKQR